VLDLLFEASSQTLLEVAADPQRLGAEIGFLSILHTWGSNLLPHYHIHAVVPGDGLPAFFRQSLFEINSQTVHAAPFHFGNRVHGLFNGFNA
jgi:hypothetical protein